MIDCGGWCLTWRGPGARGTRWRRTRRPAPHPPCCSSAAQSLNWKRYLFIQTRFSPAKALTATFLFSDEYKFPGYRSIKNKKSWIWPGIWKLFVVSKFCSARNKLLPETRVMWTKTTISSVSSYFLKEF